ncbi:hypothetical protein SAMN05443634_106198 [Chishuiella changwenlii]|uniref:Uncharacterized protein n=1 Tax=Chishuiella changwenlii TaxID=1434701 RepID=A0A1M6YDD6_9FLAO|nr:hypothetical protein [Chishuiella changwenlii]GGE97638.1 hypothetical protein GCM10010984_14020 [Chishuiella changwenlii]SHL16143.1 hypothetical protein SAMN05443634_106198 [Chishuiella changwenlii]
MLFKSSQYKIETKQSQEEVYKILSENTDKKRLHLFGKSNFEFEGIVAQDHFKFEKTINGRNSFNPMIIGKYNENINKQTLIEFELKISSFVAIFYYFWLFLMSIIGIFSLFLMKEWYIAIGVLISMLFIAFAIYYIGFSMAKENILNTFKKLFNEKIIELKQ